jgi:hypothetical protein
MKKFFEHPEEANIDIEDDICCILMASTQMEQFRMVHLSAPQNTETSRAFLSFKVSLSLITGGRVELEIDDNAPEILRTRLNNLLKKINKPRSTWQNEDGTYTARFYECKAKLPFSQLRRLKHKIWSELLHRKMEYQEMYRSSYLGIAPLSFC